MQNTDTSFYDYVQMWLNKLNITVNLTKTDIITEADKIAHKIILYEIITSAVWLVVIICIWLCMCIVYRKYFKQYNMLQIVKNTIIPEININRDEKQEKIGWQFTLCFYIGLSIILITIPCFIIQTIDIINCIVFPEKVIMDFIGRYM